MGQSRNIAKWLWLMGLFVVALSGHRVYADSPLPTPGSPLATPTALSPLPTPTPTCVRVLPTPLPPPTPTPTWTAMATFTAVPRATVRPPTRTIIATRGAEFTSPILPPPPEEPTGAPAVTPTVNAAVGPSGLHHLFVPLVLRRAKMRPALGETPPQATLVQRRARLLNQFLLLIAFIWRGCGFALLLALVAVLFWLWRRRPGEPRG